MYFSRELQPEGAARYRRKDLKRPNGFGLMVLFFAKIVKMYGPPFK